MRIRFLGAHNTETLTTRLSGLLVDQALALDAGSLTASLTLSQQLSLKGVLLTHQHYDHIRDIPPIAMNCYLSERSIAVYGTQAVRAALAEHFLNGEIYTRFLDKPALSYRVIEPLQPFKIEGYDILALPVNHPVLTVGYQVASGCRSIFYTGDAGPGLSECWRYTSPDLLVIECTASNRWTEFGRESLHMTPELLRDELAEFKTLKGYLPRVFTVHMNPSLEDEIRAELARVAEELGGDISTAREGMEVEV